MLAASQFNEPLAIACLLTSTAFLLLTYFTKQDV